MKCLLIIRFHLSYEELNRFVELTASIAFIWFSMGGLYRDICTVFFAKLD